MALIIGLLAFLALIILLRTLSSKKVKFLYRNLSAIGLGAAFGLLIYHFMPADIYAELKFYIKSVSGVYIRLLRLMIVPIIFVSITTTLIHIGKENNLGKSIGQVLAYFILSITGAALIAFATSNAFDFGHLIDITKNTAEQSDSRIAERISSIGDASLGKVIYGYTKNVPTSIFAAFAENNILGTLIIALMVGFATRRMYGKKPEKVQLVVDGLNAIKVIVNSITMTVIKLTPYGILALISVAVADKGPALFGDLAKFVGVSYLTMALIFVMHMVVKAASGLNPINHIQNLLPAIVTGFSTQSSGATLPVTIKSLEERNGVDTETANITASLGTTMGMNACGAMWPVFMIVLGVGVTNALAGTTVVDLFSVSSIVTMLLAVLVSSFGIAGLPGTASFAAITAMTLMGLDPAVMGIVLTFVLSVDSLIDMGRTATNIFGVSSAATFVSRINHRLNKETFSKK
ncbi:cation:dicarboxylase symporter family transporter [Limibacter armeniacum]|uniref:cation:dicarboxylate symporter family transporter n=1 Tax=Limibacter armeniacum TaxID=466084 RepID=UPI002FE5AF8D